ncbi:MAG TPA: HIT domain-containing protein [Bryobacteraceae bacterium]|nr:HIT domain-containing protein [Bryobacteraceae bacterium]
MDHLWSPWRYRYVQTVTPEDACIFCVKAADSHHEENLIVHRARFNFVLLNLYPYNNGHVMIAPYEHVATLEGAREETAAEMMQLTRQTQVYLRTTYNPGGFNLGMNIGEVAGAGVAGHIHLHVVPRWRGDANFMTTVGETRVLPEELSETYRKLRAAFADE